MSMDIARDAARRLGDPAETAYAQAKERLLQRVKTDGAWQARTDAEAFIQATEKLLEARPDEVRVRDAARRLGEHPSDALIQDARALLGKALDGCFCDDGGGQPECARCKRAREAWNELGKLEGAAS